MMMKTFRLVIAMSFFQDTSPMCNVRTARSAVIANMRKYIKEQKIVFVNSVFLLIFFNYVFLYFLFNLFCALLI